MCSGNSQPAAVQHLRTAYGIKTKNWNKNKATSCKSTASNLGKVFGVPLDSLPYYNMEYGSVPSFLVDACMKLLAHVETEGLFRKSGSVVRLKELRAKLDAGEECLPTARPCDVAGLVKQFFRELPEPILPTELQEAFFKAQQLPSEEERTSATMLLSCVLPDKNICVLRHFFDFLHNVSQRSAENKMDSGNLSVILAPNLLHFGDGTEKINSNMEKRLKLQAAIVHCFIENAHNFGVLPRFLQEKVPAMMGCEPGASSPAEDELEERVLTSGMKKKNRRSFGDMVCGALNKIKTNRTPSNITQPDSLVFSSTTPVVATPSSKRKLPLELRHSFGLSNKKRRSVKKNLGTELLPSTLFSGTSTPGSACSASGVLDLSQNVLSVGRSNRLPSTSARRKSKRFSHRHVVNRVESGRAGCFSPKVSKKEAPLKSLRLRFSLGKSNKDAGSESIGLRLATQESTTGFHFKHEMEFIPSNLARKTEAKSSKYISKSEDNLLTPQCDSSTHQASWIVETPVGTRALNRGSFTDTPLTTSHQGNYMSEPAIVVSKPSPASVLPKKLCCTSSSESLKSACSIAEPLRQNDPAGKIQNDVTELENDLQASKRGFCSSVGESGIKSSAKIPGTPALAFEVDTYCPPTEADEQNVTFGQFNIEALTPLHIDSGVFESSANCSPVINRGLSPPFGRCSNSTLGSVERVPQQMNCSRLIDALDIQSPAHFSLGVTSGLQSTPYRPGVELEDEPNMPSKAEILGSKSYEEVKISPESRAKVKHQPSLSPDGLQTQKRRVVDHIQHFNKLTLYSPTSSKNKEIRSPMKFQRTPVKLTVRRINSLTGESRRPGKVAELTARQAGHVTKTLSLESGLSPQLRLRPQVERSNSMVPVKKPPPVPPKRLNTLPRKVTPCALGDMTNKVLPKARMECSVSDPSAAQKPFIVQQVDKNNMSHYRGSPRNPLNHGQLLSATKPVDI
ncbi:rho GTPase-activating protein 11A isoform X2 [Girardinichthys multiradiatus]|uniref:rho GTPase-activating protein 11A isoform X2 n=1 Tax=Girardinichthys multiradiatus TaxID=208333 RepID=UPI001FAC7189|nr:rho GTPase-activating protein 11A isoform X2 [Girardinichthys multiradiatus]